MAAAVAVAQPTFGLKAGLNVATLGDFEEDQSFLDKSPRLGFVGGAFARYPFADIVSAQVEVLYSQKGVKFESVSQPTASISQGEGGASELRYNLDYIEVPVLLRVSPQVDPTLDVGVFAGPAIAFKVNESVVSVFDGTETDISGSEDFFKSTDVGIAAGADVGSGPFAVDLRYTFGLTNVADPVTINEAKGIGGGALDLKNGVFSATFVYRFGQ